MRVRVRHAIRVADLMRYLRELGCQPIRTRGSHQIWRTPRGQSFALVVNHLGHDVSRIVLAVVRRTLAREGLEIDPCQRGGARVASTRETRRT